MIRILRLFSSSFIWSVEKKSPVSICGLTVTGVLLFAVIKYNQVPNIYATIGIILIIIGVVMVNYLGKLN